MIDILGFLYEIGRDLKKHYEWKIEDKLVDLEWIQCSGFEKAAESQGWRLYWSRADKVESRKFAGYEVMFELDNSARVRRRLVTRDGMILLGKKS
jgi:hypothetical protein